MKKLSTRFCLALAMAFTIQQASATYTPVAITTGFNADVVADGIGTAISSTTGSFDNTAYCLVAPTFQLNASSTLPAQSLPATGVINSLVTSGVTFNLQSYADSNSLRLRNNNTSGTLVFTNNTYIGDVYLLCAAGDGSPTGNVVINFVGGTTQSTSVTFKDWYNGTGAAIQGLGRVNRTSGSGDYSNPTNPRLYELMIPLNINNYSKTIQSITITKTTSTGSINVMAVNVDVQSCLPPVNPVASFLTINSAMLRWRTVAGSGGYEYAITTSATPPSSGTYQTDTFYQATGLPAATLHYLHVRNKCNATTFSVWNTYSFTTVACTGVSGLNASNQTTTTALLKWNGVNASLGYQYVIDNTLAAPTGAGTFTTDTFINATNLAVGTLQYLHVRSNCTGTSYSTWSNYGFTTLPCPSAGTPVVSNNAPFFCTVSWPGSTNIGVANYEWVLTNTASAPSASNPNIQTTTNNTVNVTGLTPGVTYYAWVRSNCTATKAGWLSSGAFVNPYPQCDSITNLAVSGVTMHGAKMNWNKAIYTNPSGYQYALTQSATPPASGSAIADSFYIATSLTANTTYYFHVRTICGGAPNFAYTHYSSWVTDSFTTFATCQVPTGIAITNVTSSSADINWNDALGIYNFEYFIDQMAASPTVAGNPVIYNALAPLNLFSGTNYYFHLRIRCDTTNYSPWVNTAFVTPTVCTAPSNPIVSNIGAQTATFNWGAVPGAINYEHAITTTATPPASGTPASGTSYTANSLTPSTSYFFHVRAYCSANDISVWKTAQFNTTALGINEVLETNGGVLIYPNPVKDKVVIELNPHGKANGKIQVIDMAGKVVFTANANKDKTELNLSTLPSGIYMVRYVDDANARVMRIQKL